MKLPEKKMQEWINCKEKEGDGKIATYSWEWLNGALSAFQFLREQNPSEKVGCGGEPGKPAIVGNLRDCPGCPDCATKREPLVMPELLAKNEPFRSEMIYLQLKNLTDRVNEQAMDKNEPKHCLPFRGISLCLVCKMVQGKPR